ncbi:hypothetical protein SLE2022_037300 [Rubroshorea leprosula]
MVYSYTPAYYSSIHDSIASLCKTILPFSLKKRRLQAAEHRLSTLQSDNLKWQQDSFHQILNLMGLHKEGILAESEVAAFRTHLLETLIASPPEPKQTVILRDKLVFLQELLYAKCITEEEYHSSKRPLLQQLAVQGAEIEARDIIVSKQQENQEEEWSVIDLKDESCLLNGCNSQPCTKSNSAVKQIKEAASVFGFLSSHKASKNRTEKSIFDSEPKFSVFSSTKNDLACSGENPFWDSDLKNIGSQTKSILMQETSSIESINIKKSGGSTANKVKRKPFRTLFHREQREEDGGENCPGSEEKGPKDAKKQWGFDGFKKWKKNDSDDETAPLHLNERSDSEAYIRSIGEGPDTKQIKRNLHANGSPSDFFIDKVLGDKIKKELSRIQTELSTTNPNLQFSNEQIEAISTTLPVDKTDLKKFFPKSWCDRYGDVVLDVVKKEFKEHVGELEHTRNSTREKHSSNTRRWVAFEDENHHPNLFANSNHTSVGAKGFKSNNPLFRDYNGKPESICYQDQNPFWNPRHD